MLAISPKGTVPVLHLPDGRVLDESLDIMRWALALSDPEHWLPSSTAFADARIAENDTSFKQALDRYKYAPRFPEHPAEYYRDQACEFIEKLENKLGQSAHLQGGARGFTDAAIFPFVRQFAGVESNWFAQSRYREVNRWLSAWLDSPLFARVMQKN